MGYVPASLVVTVTLSAHNSEQDTLDQERFEALREEISDICQKPEYQEIMAEVVS